MRGGDSENWLRILEYLGMQKADLGTRQYLNLPIALWPEYDKFCDNACLITPYPIDSQQTFALVPNNHVSQLVEGIKEAPYEYVLHIKLPIGSQLVSLPNDRLIASRF